jgi:hypothetical protein
MTLRHLLLIPLLLLAGCFAKKSNNSFDLTANQALTKVARDLEFGSEIGGWLREVARACNANAPSCPSMIIADMEKQSYQDDNKPDHLLHDALIERLTSSEFGVTILERDPDIIGLLEMERNGVKLPTSMEPIDTTEGDDMTPDERRQQAGSLIAEITSVLAAQDVLLFAEEECCNGGDGLSNPPEPTAIIANEVGEIKAQLIRDLVHEYLALFPKGVPREIPQRVIDVDISDFLFAYRIYEYNNEFTTAKLTTDRRTSLEIHVRIIDLASGEIIVSDFLSNEFTETLNLLKKRDKKEKTKKLYGPYTSLGIGFQPYSLSGLHDSDGKNRAVSSAPGFLLEYNHWTKRAYRFTGRVGGARSGAEYEADVGDVLSATSIVFGTAFTFDKVIFYNRPFQVLGGVGLDFGYAVGQTVTLGDPGADPDPIPSQTDQTSGWAAALTADLGFVYNINLIGLEVGVHQPLYSLASAGDFTADSGGIGQTSSSTGSPYSAPQFRIGLNYAFCSVLQLPGAPGNSCTRGDDLDEPFFEPQEPGGSLDFS